MTEVTLIDRASLLDLKQYLSRARRLMDKSVRLYGEGPLLAVYVPVAYPKSLFDPVSTVLGLRIFALEADCRLESLVSLGSLLDRVSRLVVEADEGDLSNSGGCLSLPMPHSVPSVTWAGIVPPRTGWKRSEDIPAAALELTASGQKPLELAGLPDAVATGLKGLGFLNSVQQVKTFTAAGWKRLTTPAGHVLVKQPRSAA